MQKERKKKKVNMQNFILIEKRGLLLSLLALFIEHLCATEKKIVIKVIKSIMTQILEVENHSFQYSVTVMLTSKAGNRC